MPVIRLKSVLLPAPFGPTTETISPSSTCRSRLSTTVSPPKRSDTPLSSSSGIRNPLPAPPKPAPSLFVSLRRAYGSYDLHAPFAEQAVRAHDHQRDQDQPEHDVARRLRL